MKVVVKNNRLSLEARADSLSKVSDARLKELARKWQIGLQVLQKTTVQRNKDGKVYEEEQLIYQNKPRVGLEDEIRKALTITLDIPKEFWTEAQQYAWSSTGAEDIKEVGEEAKIKQEAGILTVLKPFEEGLDNFATSKLLCELTEEQWEYFKSVYNFHDKETDERDETGRVVRERVYPQRLAVHEYVPESDEDIEKLKTMKPTKAVTESLKKHDKSTSKKNK